MRFIEVFHSEEAPIIIDADKVMMIEGEISPDGTKGFKFYFEDGSFVRSNLSNEELKMLF